MFLSERQLLLYALQLPLGALQLLLDALQLLLCAQELLLDAWELLLYALRLALGALELGRTGRSSSWPRSGEAQPIAVLLPSIVAALLTVPQNKVVRVSRARSRRCSRPYLIGVLRKG